MLGQQVPGFGSQGAARLSCGLTNAAAGTTKDRRIRLRQSPEVSSHPVIEAPLKCSKLAFDFPGSKFSRGSRPQFTIILKCKTNNNNKNFQNLTLLLIFHFSLTYKKKKKPLYPTDLFLSPSSFLGSSGAESSRGRNRPSRPRTEAGR